MAIRSGSSVLTIDPDFELIASVIQLQLEFLQLTRMLRGLHTCHVVGVVVTA